MRTRDQERALHVYDRVTRLDASLRGEYKTLAKDLGANVMRSGLCAALAFIHRNVKESAGASRPPSKAARSRDPRAGAARALLDHLTEALQATRIPALVEVQQSGDLFATVRRLEVDAYMLATREVLRLAMWFRRAVDTFEDPPQAP